MPGFRLRFTSFSGHRPAQRECAWTALRSHASCHPYPIPQPGKVGHTTEVYDPYSLRIVMCVLLCPTRTNQWKCCEMGPTVFHPYLRRLESLTIYRCHYKGSTFFSVLLRPWVLVRPGFEPVTSRSQIGALLTELTRRFNIEHENTKNTVVGVVKEKIKAITTLSN